MEKKLFDLCPDRFSFTTFFISDNGFFRLLHSIVDRNIRSSISIATERVYSLKLYVFFDSWQHFLLIF